MQLNRERQREMLEKLATIYPSYSTDCIAQDSESDLANLYYLQEHGLVNAALDRTLSGAFIFSGAIITAKGLDFLADDGGLSAILGTVTVKLHAETIRDLLLSKVENSNEPDAKKSWLKSQISSLSGEALKTITNSLVQKGLDNIPDLVVWAQQIFTKS